MKIELPKKISGLALVLVGLFLSSMSFAGDLPSDAARSIPIQHSGQVKSFESFARQTLMTIASKSSWNKKPASLVIFEAIANPETMGDLAWIKINLKGLVSYLGLPERERGFYSFNEVFPVLNKLEALVRSAEEKRNRDERPSLLEQRAEGLDGAMFEVKNLMSGDSLKVIPPPEDGNTWSSPLESKTELTEKFAELLSLYREKKFEEFKQKAGEWSARIHDLTHSEFKKKVGLEVLYFDLKPFQYAWILYVLAFIILSLIGKKGILRKAGIAALAAAILFHTLGLTLRVLILQRPPVSNMYESMIYMNWVLIVVAAIFSVVRKSPTAVSVGALISGVILIYGNLLPIDTSLDVLVPVLRSNYWLTVHVLTIVSSYGVLTLAMGLGHRYLILDMRGKLTKKEENASAQTIYRVMQIGLILEGIGTILGGVWANESWGRFWGWDPKETWALITFLGYLLIVHLRLTKVLNNFFLAVSSILGFLLVLMTWYGVNFVLGRGLHSYGFSSGGMVWVVYYLIAEALFLALVFRKGFVRS